MRETLKKRLNYMLEMNIFNITQM